MGSGVNIITLAQGMGVIIPAPPTLAKYALTAEEWCSILAAQGWICPICRKFPKTGRFVTDHEHVRGWADMVKRGDASRKRYVRGVTCWFCNHYRLTRSITPEIALNVASYLEAYHERLIQAGRNT